MTELQTTQRAVPLTRLRRAVAKVMTESATVPQFTLDWDMDLRAVRHLRRSLPIDVSVVDLIHAAITRTLTRHPALNSSWQQDHIIEYTHVNLGVAVAVTDGLLAPAIIGAERLGLTQLAAARMGLQERAQTSRLTPEELTSATFTVSNLAPFGVFRMQPLVLPPQAAILGLAACRKSGEATFTLACDHRVTDGVPASRFLQELSASLCEPAWMHELART